jgi:hypothetical protein
VLRKEKKMAEKSEKSKKSAPAPDDDWYQTGFSKKNLEKAEKESSRAPSRLWIPKDNSKEIIILDDDPFCVWEHSLKINGKWKGNEFTCRKGLPDDPRCPLCSSKANRYYIGFLTVLDHTGFKDDDGNWHKNLRRLFPMKLETLKIYAKFKERKVSLVGWKVECTRTSGRNIAAIGNSFEFIEKVDPFTDEQFFYESRLEGGKKKPPEIFNYKELFKPMSVKEMLALADRAGESYETKDKDDDEEEGTGGDGDAPY